MNNATLVLNNKVIKLEDADVLIIGYTNNECIQERTETEPSKYAKFQEIMTGRIVRRTPATVEVEFPYDYIPHLSAVNDDFYAAQTVTRKGVKIFRKDRNDDSFYYEQGTGRSKNEEVYHLSFSPVQYVEEHIAEMKARAEEKVRAEAEYQLRSKQNEISASIRSLTLEQANAILAIIDQAFQTSSGTLYDQCKN